MITALSLCSFTTRAFSGRPSSVGSTVARRRRLVVRGGGSVFGVDGDHDGDDDRPRPSTGWLHNQPTSSRSSSSPTPPDAPPARTGWLHNTAPKPEAIARTEAASAVLNEAREMLAREKLRKRRRHRVVSPPAFHPAAGGARAVVTEHEMRAPLRWDDDDDDESDDEVTTIFFTVVEKINNNNDDDNNLSFFETLRSTALSSEERAARYVRHRTNASDAILYLQGGPGFGARRPVSGTSLESGWLSFCLSKYGRVVLMDQRGTGRSDPITKQTLEMRFPDLFDKDDKGEEEVNKDVLSVAVDYLTCFRADSIVKDAEEIRKTLSVYNNNDDDDANAPWGAVLGQSYGGFCIAAYLSLGLALPPKVCLLTGGVAPLLCPHPYDLYAKLWERVRKRNLRYYDEYPGDVAVVKRIVRTLLERPPALPLGGVLTARRFLSLGIDLGGSPDAFAAMHALLDGAFVRAPLHQEEENNVFSRAFLKRVDAVQPFDDAPLYYLLHESIYADGPDVGATNWAAHRALRDRSDDAFSYERTCSPDDPRPVLFFGETVFPWFSDGDFAELSGRGLRAVARALATKHDWGRLYDPDNIRDALASGRSRAAAAVYVDDMYVDLNESLRAADEPGAPLERCAVYVTNEYQHSGLRDDGETILKKLTGMVEGTVRTPS